MTTPSRRLALAALCLVLGTLLSAAQTAGVPDLVGQWDLTTISPIGESTNIVEFRKEGDALKAFAKGARGERPYDSMNLEGTALTLVITVEYEGAPMVITYRGTVTEKSINGSADFGGMALGSFAATRREPAAPQ